MKLSGLYYKLFGGGEWMVGWREAGDRSASYKIAKVPKGQWVADPFLYEEEGRHYLFVEQYEKSKQRAGIGLFEFIDNEPINRGMIISQPYHMSYPCVFSYRGERYMIPETSANQTIEMYRATDFPHGWVKDTVLLQGKKYVDSTVYQSGDDMLLLSYSKADKGWKLTIFKLDMENRVLTEVQPVTFTENTGRPAGGISDWGGHLMRPSQDCRRKYGEALLLNSIDALGEAAFKEHVSGVISSSDIRFPVKQQRVHTINHDSRYEVIDVFQEQFDPLHAVRIFMRAHRLK